MQKIMDQGNNEVADIYERVLKGDKSAISQLQKIQKTPSPNKISKVAKHEQLSVNASPPRKKDHMQSQKSQNLRSNQQKISTEFHPVKPSSKNQLKKASPSQKGSEYREPKPFSKNRKINEVSTQNNFLSEPPKGSVKQIQVRQPKITSDNFQMRMNKNIVKDPIAENDYFGKVSTPESKNSFRVRSVTGSKKLIDELLRINEEERKLQSEIMHLHTSSKDQISQVVQKYGIKINEALYRVDGDHLDSSNISGFSSKMASQEIKLQIMSEQLKKIDKQLQSRKNSISKKQAKIQMLPLLTYINSVPDIFEERQSEEENNVDELPSSVQHPLDPTRTYQSMMGQIRKKNWGLNKRINYDYDSIKNQTQNSLKKVQKSLEKIEQNGENRVVVNQRLRQFLFD